MIMPLLDGTPTCHELRIKEMCERDPEFAEAYNRFRAEISEYDDRIRAEQVDDDE